MYIFAFALTVSFAIQRYLRASAPSNVLIHHVRGNLPSWRTTGWLVGLTAALLGALRAVDLLVATGAPALLSLAGAQLGWNAIKTALLACHSAIRCAFLGLRCRTHSKARNLRDSRFKNG